jgi:hypothetical protein
MAVFGQARHTKSLTEAEVFSFTLICLKTGLNKNQGVKIELTILRENRRSKYDRNGTVDGECRRRKQSSTLE